MKNENGQEKSAILKGKTLVNVVGEKYRDCNLPTSQFVTAYGMDNVYDSSSYRIKQIDLKYPLSPNKEYLIIVNVQSMENCSMLMAYTYDGTNTDYNASLRPKKIGLNVVRYTPTTAITRIAYFVSSNTEEKVVFGQPMIIEYQEGMESWDIPYFEGMQSIGVPILTTTGKNLFDKSKVKYNTIIHPEGQEEANNLYMSSDFINVEPNENYISNNMGVIFYYDKNRNFIDKIDNSILPQKFTTPNDCKYIRVRCWEQYDNLEKQKEIVELEQIEQGSTATSYEPYQSNILTVNEDVTLRGIGDVKDELNLMTGEVIENTFNLDCPNTNFEISDISTSSTNTIRFMINNANIKSVADSSKNNMCNKLPYKLMWSSDEEGYYVTNSNRIVVRLNKDKITSTISREVIKNYLIENNFEFIVEKSEKSIKTVDLTIQDQDNQPQERMRLFPKGYINTSSSTFPPTLELKGITHNNKLNMTTTNGTNNTQLTTLDNLVLDGIICRDGTVVRDSYDVESGLYTKRVFRFTIDEEFIERYRGKWKSSSNAICFEPNLSQATTSFPKSSNSAVGIANNMTYNNGGEINRVCVNTGGTLYVRLLKEELVTYDIDGLLEWVKRNGAIEVAYPMATPQIIHMQPNMTPYVSTRPYQGEINSQGNALESSFLDYTQEESILSPKPLGEGDVLRWEQGSQCYVYENDKDYIPLTDYNQKVGTVLDLEDDEQFVENLDGGEIVVDAPFKEKAVYERELVSYEDTVIYPTTDKLDPDGKVEVDYVCGATWQNPDDLSDIQHLGTLREDGQYDVTIRRSGDDEIRFMDGTTHLTLNHEGLNPSEFELTYYNKDNVEVGKYGDTSHMLENTLVDGKLETGVVYGETLVNKATYTGNDDLTHTGPGAPNDRWYRNGTVSCEIERTVHSAKIIPTTIANTNMSLTYRICNIPNYKYGQVYTAIFTVVNNTPWDLKIFASSTGYASNDGGKQIGTVLANSTGKVCEVFTTHKSIDYKIGHSLITPTSVSQTVEFKDLAILEGDYTSYPMDIPYFEGVSSTTINGFTTTGKNLLDKTYQYNNTEHRVGVYMDTVDVNTFRINGMATTQGDVDFYGKSYNDMMVCKPNTTYYAKAFIVSGSYTNAKNLALEDRVNFKFTDEFGGNISWAGKKATTSSVQNRLSRVRFTFYVDEEWVFDNLVVQIMLIEGDTAPTEFEPYHSIQYTLPSPITLNKVGNVADTYNVATGVETRNVAMIVPQANLRFTQNDEFVGIAYTLATEERIESSGTIFETTSINTLGIPFINSNLVDGSGNIYGTSEGIGRYTTTELKIILAKSRLNLPEYTKDTVNQWLKENLVCYIKKSSATTIQHTLIPSTVEIMQEPTFILPQPLRSVPNGICDRLYWDENKGHYCIEKRIEEVYANGSQTYKHRNNGDGSTTVSYQLEVKNKSLFDISRGYCYPMPRSQSSTDGVEGWGLDSGNPNIFLEIKRNKLSEVNVNGFVQWITENPQTVIYPSTTSEIIDLPHLNRKLELPTYPDELPVGYKAVHSKMNPQIGLTIPYKQLNPPSQPQNLDFQMNKEDYVLTWSDVKEARQYNVILNDNIVATTKVPWYNTGEEIHGYILVEAQNEIADNLSKELYVKTVPKAPAQLTVAHNGLTDNYDFEISFIKSTSSLADRYTVQYRVDGGEWIIQDIPADEVDANVKVLWKFSVFEIKNQIEVWATATNDMGTNDILPLSTYYMTPTPQWTYRINSREVFLRWVDESPYDTQYKLRYQYKSDGIYRYAHFEGDKEEIGQLYEAVVALAEDDEVTLELCVISDRENLYCKPIKASKALDPNILPPKNFNYRWLSRGLIEFYWEDVYDVDLEYEAIVEHRLSGEISWIEDRRVFSATDTEGAGTVYRLQYQMEDLEEIRVKVRMKWAMNETEWSESLTTVFIPVEGNPPQWIRRTQTQEGLLVEWEAQEYIDSYHVYVKGDGVELQHLETKDNFIYVDIDYSNPIDIEIYEVSRFTGGIEAEPSDSMRFIPHQNKQQMINNIYHPDSLKYEIEVDTVQKAQKASYQINDINTTPDVRTREAMDVSISSPFIITYHPLEVDVHQKGVKSYGVAETHIKTLDVKTRETVEVLTFERITDKYGMDFTVYTPFASKYPVNLEINQVRIVCLGDSLTSGHPLYWAESGTGDVTASYPYQLAKRLKNQYEVINKGYGSDTTDRCLARFDKDVLAYSPQYCLYQCGTNDKVYVVVKSFELLGTP